MSLTARLSQSPSRWLLCLCGTALALSSVSAWAQGTNPAPATTVAANTPGEFDSLVAQDQAAQDDVAKWQQNSRSLTNREQQAGLQRRVGARLDQVNQKYLDFIGRHPASAPARLSYGCFLNARGDESGAEAQWTKALELDPHNADAYNNLATRYSEVGPAKKAFDYFNRAIELKPSEAVYYHNFADTMYVLRSHAMTNYGLTEQQVFSRALDLYSNAARLAPQNANYAWDYAQTYYALKPMPYPAALRAWTNALGSAATELDREKIYLHLARIKMLAGKIPQARAQLGAVTNASVADMKTRLLRALDERAGKAKGSISP